MRLLPSHDEEINKTLDDAAEEYKELLYKALITRSEGIGNYKTSELRKIDNEAKRPLYDNFQTQRKRQSKLLRIGLGYLIIIFICVMISLGFMLYDKNPFNDLSSKIAIAIAAITGLLSCVSAVFGLSKLSSGDTSRIKTTEDEMPFLHYGIVTKWRELEALASDINSNRSLKSSSSTIGVFFENKLINDDEYLILKQFLRMRNAVVHNMKYEYSVKKTRDVLEQVDGIITKIQERI